MKSRLDIGQNSVTFSKREGRTPKLYAAETDFFQGRKDLFWFMVSVSYDREGVVKQSSPHHGD
jgi:hypothetical protein